MLERVSFELPILLNCPEKIASIIKATKRMDFPSNLFLVFDLVILWRVDLVSERTWFFWETSV